MAWAKSKPMTWEWFQEEAFSYELADVCAKLSKAKQTVKCIAGPVGSDPMGEPKFIIVSVKGTPIKKAKEADHEK